MASPMQLLDDRTQPAATQLRGGSLARSLRSLRSLRSFRLFACSARPLRSARSAFSAPLARSALPLSSAAPRQQIRRSAAPHQRVRRLAALQAAAVKQVMTLRILGSCRTPPLWLSQRGGEGLSRAGSEGQVAWTTRSCRRRSRLTTIVFDRQLLWRACRRSAAGQVQVTAGARLRGWSRLATRQRQQTKARVQRTARE